MNLEITRVIILHIGQYFLSFRYPLSLQTMHFPLYKLDQIKPELKTLELELEINANLLICGLI